MAFSLHCAHVAALLQRHCQRQRHRTLTFDDPGIGAELPLVFNHIHAGGADQNDFDVSVTKTITPNFSLTTETDYLAAKWLGGDLYWLAILPITSSVVFLLLQRSLARRCEVRSASIYGKSHAWRDQSLSKLKGTSKNPSTLWQSKQLGTV